MKLEGKTALITGGASGIGKATVLEFARCGATVICADVNEQKGAELQKEAKETNYAVEFVAVDLADPSSIRMVCTPSWTDTSTTRVSALRGTMLI